MRKATHIQWVVDRDAVKHPVMLRTTPTTKNYLDQMSIERKLRNSVLKDSYCLQNKIQMPQHSLQHSSLPFPHSPWLTMLQPQASFLLLEHTKLVSATGPLCLLFPQPESLLPRFSGCWHHPCSGLCSNVTSFVRSSPTHLSLSTHPCSHPYPRNNLLYLLHPSKY